MNARKTTKRTIKIDRYSIDISNEDKIFFPKSKITKGDVIAYYIKVASRMLAYIKGRPISMQRFPEGITKEGFFQKEAGSYFPNWITTMAIAKEAGAKVNYVIVDNEATIVYLANQACLVFHPWLSKYDKLMYPDRIIFDLDPAGKATFELVRWTAFELKKVLDTLKLESFVMLTGSRGVHIWIPIKREQNYDKVKSFARTLARVLVKKYPDKLTLEMQKKKRGNKIFIDFLRNAFGQTGVAPYSLRAKEGAPIAMPITWKELANKKIGPQKFTISNGERQIKKNPWKKLLTTAYSLKNAQKKLDAMLEHT